MLLLMARAQKSCLDPSGAADGWTREVQREMDTRSLDGIDQMRLMLLEGSAFY